jgi:hypothetical protein
LKGAFSKGPEVLTPRTEEQFALWKVMGGGVGRWVGGGGGGEREKVIRTFPSGVLRRIDAGASSDKATREC